MTLALRLAALALAAALPAWAEEPRSVAGLTSPESALVASDGRILVSEIGGFGKDGDGRVSVVDAAGKLVPWATRGLDDPKGLAERAGIVYAADKARVVKISRDGVVAVFAAATAFPKAPMFLNDLAFDTAGNLYVSDSGDLKNGGQGSIYRIDTQGRVTLIVDEAANPAIRNPNGLLTEGKGKLLVIDFASGELLRLEIASGKTEKLAEGFGGGDGIARDAAGMLYLSDWKGGRVWKLDARKPGAAPRLYGQAFQAAADLTVSRGGKHLLVPDMKAGTLVWLPK